MTSRGTTGAFFSRWDSCRYTPLLATSGGFVMEEQAPRAKRRMGIWVFLLVGAVIVTIAVWSETERRRALAPVAQALGLAYTPGLQRLPPEWDAAGLYLFTQGAPEVLNLMRGRRGDDAIALFGYGYDAPQGEEGSREVPVGDAGQSERRLQTVLWVQGGRPLPDFDLSPTRGSLRRVGNRFGMAAVTIEGQAAFRDRYVLAARDPAAVRALFTPPVLDALTAQPGWFIEGRGNQWLLYRVKERVAPAGMGAFLDRGLGLLDLLRGPAEGRRP